MRGYDPRYQILKTCYDNLNRFSTSSAHTIAAKLAAHWFVYGKHSRGEVATAATEFLFRNGYRGDIVVGWRNGDVWTENIEVLNPLHYPHTLYYNGLDQFKEYVSILEDSEIIDERQAQNIRRKISKGRSRPGQIKNNGTIHFHTDKTFQHLPIAKKVDKPCEVERKYDAWDHQTNEMSFLLGEELWPRFRADIKRSELKINHIYFMSGKDVETIIKYYQERKQMKRIHESREPFELPPELMNKELIREKKP